MQATGTTIRLEPSPYDGRAFPGRHTQFYLWPPTDRAVKFNGADFCAKLTAIGAKGINTSYNLATFDGAVWFVLPADMAREPLLDAVREYVCEVLGEDVEVNFEQD